jgi:hypothetical protein
MLFLSYAYRFLSNFVFLALVYFALNFLEKYQRRHGAAVVSFLPAHRAAGDRGAPPDGCIGRGAEFDLRAQADRH